MRDSVTVHEKNVWLLQVPSFNESTWGLNELPTFNYGLWNPPHCYSLGITSNDDTQSPIIKRIIFLQTLVKRSKAIYKEANTYSGLGTGIRDTKRRVHSKVNKYFLWALLVIFHLRDIGAHPTRYRNRTS